MAGSSNFLVHNPTCANQESDATYAADATRVNGIQFNQIMPSGWMNKLWYQCALMVAALAQMLANKGFTVNDGSASPSTAFAGLVAVLSSILTTSDIPGTPWQSWYTNTNPPATVLAPSGSLAILMGTNNFNNFAGIPATPQRVIRFLNRGIMQNIGASSSIQFWMDINSTITGSGLAFTPGNNNVWDWEYEVILYYAGSSLWGISPKLTAVDRSVGTTITRMIGGAGAGVTGAVINSAYSQVNATPSVSSPGFVTQNFQVISTEN